jgi:hypothetical protein
MVLTTINENAAAFSYSSIYAPHDMMVLLPHTMRYLLNHRPISQVRALNNWSPHVSLQDVQHRAIAGILLHEMSHSRYILGEDDLLGNLFPPVLDAMLCIKCH